MPLTIENKEDSGIALFRLTRIGKKYFFVSFLFPSQKEDIPQVSPFSLSLCEIPLAEEAHEKALVVLDGAREAIPVIAVMGRGLNGYYVESLPRGGKVNGFNITVGSPLEDAGIIFTATDLLEAEELS